MARPNLVVNNLESGNASGAGPGDGVTAGSKVTGTAAAHTSNAASTTIEFDNSPDLSNVLADGSHAIWLDTGTGRRWSRIDAVDDTLKTVTVEDTFTIDNASPIDYAIGGKIEDLLTGFVQEGNGNNNLSGGWGLEIQYTGTDYDLGTTQLNMQTGGGQTNGYIKVYGTGGRPKITISQTANGGQMIAMNSTSNFLWFENLHLEFTIGNGAAGFQKLSGGDRADNNRWWNVKFIVIKDDTLSSGFIILDYTGNSPELPDIQNCHFEFQAGLEVIQDDDRALQFSPSVGKPMLQVENCYFKNVGGYAIRVEAGDGAKIRNNIFDNCCSEASSDQVIMLATDCTGAYVENNVIYGSASDGIYFSNNGSWAASIIKNNVIVNCGGYGINASDSTFLDKFRKESIDWNLFNNNTSGDYNSARLPFGDNNIQATDPQFTNPAVGNFKPRPTSPLLKAGHPKKIGIYS